MGKQSKRRSRPRHRGAQARANSDLGTHIASLGLKTVGEYQRWCRKHGFTGALTKGWQERRQEREAARRDTAASDADATVQEHIKALNLTDVSAYQQWCRDHGLSDALHKGDRQRHKEVEIAREAASRQALRRVRRLTRRPHETIDALFTGQTDTTDLKPAWLGHVGAILDGIDAAPDPETADSEGYTSRRADSHRVDTQEAIHPTSTRDAFRRLLLHTERMKADLFSLDPALGRFGDAPGNCWIDGLLRIAQLHDHWQRPLEDWRPQGHNARRHFGALLRHLLTCYDVPDLIDTLFLQPDDETLPAATGWFLHIATGGHIRSAPELPAELTKRMAHETLQAPGHYTMLEAIRYGQIIGQGGDIGLVEALLTTRLGRSFEHEDFWATAIHWFTKHPMIDLDLIGLIVDYIQERKFPDQQIPQPSGDILTEGPPEPNFSMKSRSVNKLLDLVETWHTRLARENRIPASRWNRSDIGEFEETEQDKKGYQLTWTVQELTTTAELVAEGRALSHCVRSYATGCRSGRHAVFSVQLQVDDDRPDRLMTIAVNPKTRVISQMRGRFNALPTGKVEAGGPRRRSLSADYRLDLRASRGVVRRWMETEGIRRGAKT